MKKENSFEVQVSIQEVMPEPEIFRGTYKEIEREINGSQTHPRVRELAQDLLNKIRSQTDVNNPRLKITIKINVEGNQIGG